MYNIDRVYEYKMQDGGFNIYRLELLMLGAVFISYFDYGMMSNVVQ